MTPETFWRNVARRERTACWPWRGATTRDGHGTCRWHGHTTGAHRVAYELASGQAPLPQIVIRHLCNNPACCNPAHLVPGGHTDNVADRVAADHSAGGERNGRSKLTWADVTTIREQAAQGRTYASLAQQYHIDATQVSRIVRGLQWPAERADHPYTRRVAAALTGSSAA